MYTLNKISNWMLVLMGLFFLNSGTQLQAKSTQQAKANENFKENSKTSFIALLDFQSSDCRFELKVNGKTLVKELEGRTNGASFPITSLLQNDRVELDIIISPPASRKELDLDFSFKVSIQGSDRSKKEVALIEYLDLDLKDIFPLNEKNKIGFRYLKTLNLKESKPQSSSH